MYWLTKFVCVCALAKTTESEFEDHKFMQNLRRQMIEITAGDEAFLLLLLVRLHEEKHLCETEIVLFCYFRSITK